MMPHGSEAAGVTEGEILAGKYRVERVLGVGGMGVVVSARHIDLDEKVAIKFMLPAMLADGDAVSRFQREAKAAVRIKSEHVARVLDVGRLENGAPYMVMEYLEGSDLAGWLEKYGALSIMQAVDFLIQACVAVADAHALGIIHRDLKPANLFCVRRSDGQLSVKVLDFGISKLVEPPGAGMSFTRTTATMGSPLYMSPEQFRSSKNVDQRTDIWALGAILFELLTARAPFSATTVPELAIKIATEPPLSVSALRPDVPADLARIITRCLEKEPERRFANVAELAEALGPFASPPARALVHRIQGIVGMRDSTAAISAPPSQLARPEETRTAPAIHYTSPETVRRRSLALPIGLLGGAALVGAAGLVWWRMERSLPEPAPSALALTASAVPPAAPPVTGAPSVDQSEHNSAAARKTVEAADSIQAPMAPSGLPATAQPVPASGGRRKDKPPVPKGARPAARTSPAPTAAAAAAQATPAAQPASAAGSHVNCDPPFYFDAKGNRVFKQECL